MDRPNVGTATVVRGNALNLSLEDNSVDLIVTSPPYFGLRSYQDGGEHYEGQIGAEATPAEFVDALVAATAEMVRVLKPSGSIWVNLGDKYAGQSALGDTTFSGQGARDGNRRSRPARVQGVRPKSLIGVPWRYAIRCIDDLGLILRAEVIWSKPNGLPESVTDRVRRSHETWFHFTKEPRYYSAVDEIREQSEQGRPQAKRAQELAARYGIGSAHRDALLARGLGDQGRSAATQSGTGKNTLEVLALCAEADSALGSYTREFTMTSQTLGKLPGSVWTIPTQPLRVPDHLGIDHFAAFPMEWPRRIIRGWSPAGVCVECSEGRRPVSERVGGVINADAGRSAVARLGGTMSGGTERSTLGGGNAAREITGESCACPTPDAATRPAVVLDPFGGTGTTALVAKALGRHGISNDMSSDYCRLATWRTNDPGELARALQVDKPAEQVPGQADLFDLFTAGGA